MIPDLVFIPPVIAHRGAGQTAPENTLAAISRAHEEGARWVEFDVKITYDGVPILMHDESLERTTDGQGLVSEVMWKDVKICHAGREKGVESKDEYVPHLTDALQEVIKCGLSAIIEMKPCPGRAKATTMVAMIEIAKVWPEGEVFPVISSFDMECLEVAAQLEPPWPRCVLMREWDEDWLTKVEQSKACAISFYAEHLTAGRVTELKEAGVSVLAYAVSDIARIKEMLAWGVDAVYACSPRQIIDQL
ncbi:MAG: glycerophosphodiester phosphodiesterase family protein [Bdellovibrionales bacterium]